MCVHDECAALQQCVCVYTDVLCDIGCVANGMCMLGAGHTDALRAPAACLIGMGGLRDKMHAVL